MTARFALFNKQNQEVWVSPLDYTWYEGKISEWDGDTGLPDLLYQ